MENELAQLRAEAATLREALEAADLILQQVLSMYPDVVISGTRDAHEQANAALATDAGCPLLERLRQAERERDDLLTERDALLLVGNLPRV